MAVTLKGIVIQLGADSSKLTTELAKVNKAARDTNDVLKNANAGLKFDPQNTVLMAEKQKALSQAVQQTNDKIKLYTAGMDALEQKKRANGSLTEAEEAQYSKLRVSIEKTKSVQKNYLSELDKVSREYTELTGDVDKYAQDTLQANQQILESIKRADSAVDELGDSYAQAGSKAKTGGTQSVNLWETTAGKIGAAGMGLQNAGATMSVVSDKIIDAGKQAVQLGSDLEEARGKVKVCFGDSSDAVTDFAKTTSEQFGIAEGTALDMAGLFGNMATSMDIPDQKAAEMSTTLVGLAGDVASFNNIDLSQASTALNGIFTGETESLKRLGIVMTQDQLLAYAVSNGLIDTSLSAEELALRQSKLTLAQEKYNEAVRKHGPDSTQAMQADINLQKAAAAMNEQNKASLDGFSQAELVALRYQFVLDGLANAQGDYARTADGYANTSRTFQETMKEMLAAFGEEIIPVITPFIKDITEKLREFSKLPPDVKKIIVIILGIVAALGPLLTAIGGIAMGISAIMTIVGAVGAGAAAAAALVIAAVIAVIAVIALVVTHLDDIKAAAETAIGWVSDRFSELGNFLGGVGTAISNGIGAAVQWVGDRIADIGNFIMGIVNAVGGAIQGAIQWVLDRYMDAFNLGRSIGEGLKAWWDGLPEWARGIGEAIANFLFGPLRAAIDGVKAIWNNTLGGFKFTLPDWLPIGGGATFELPKLAAGGYVKHRPGGIFANIGEGSSDEVVSPVPVLKQIIRDALQAQPAYATAGAPIINITVDGRDRGGRELANLIAVEVKRATRQRR